MGCAKKIKKRQEVLGSRDRFLCDRPKLLIMDHRFIIFFKDRVFDRLIELVREGETIGFVPIQKSEVMHDVARGKKKHPFLAESLKLFPEGEMLGGGKITIEA